MAFIKKVEDFVCEHCGFGVRGSGFTNHCPKCLWSKHVDKDPGDRLESCGGMMEPWDTEMKHNHFRIIHRCVACGFERPSPLVPEDSMDVFHGVSEKSAKRKADALR